MAAFGFTPASEQDVFSIGPELTRPKPSIELSGEEARQFYEDMIKDDKEQDAFESAVRTKHCGRTCPIRQKSGGCSRRMRRRVRCAEVHQVQSGPVVQRRVSGESQVNQGSSSERSMELLGLRLLRCAHEGDISSLKDLLSKGVDINFQDTFFWTAVMCASWSGQKAAVRLLLSHGAAWVGVVDTQGRDAQDLALEAGHNEVLEELLNYGRSPERETQSNSSALQPQWCDVCCSEYRISPSSHLSSTLHQFSLRRPPPTPYYCLPPSSNSYKMMVRCGWKPGTGLGPEGEGPQQPVPTVLKRDQKGLGYGQMKRSKVTHFQARDHDAVKPPHREKEERHLKGQRREETKRKEQRDKNWERDFRSSFYL
ncbi:G patch domain and ankyrin repeat-containing protein 1 [Melanotaenia boesemani]|uniref:G patch domain and ankyrin repeat-containing protein 1 n=1 Tax=Melanotaenia boesemani TaxID=1250792 RepID=UPI001C04E8D8|nr:G patch domain and ankyrin repeat-containing protein 1 [Melanotaenia boesemani]